MRTPPSIGIGIGIEITPRSEGGKKNHGMTNISRPCSHPDVEKFKPTALKLAKQYVSHWSIKAQPSKLT